MHGFRSSREELLRYIQQQFDREEYADVLEFACYSFDACRNFYARTIGHYLVGDMLFELLFILKSGSTVRHGKQLLAPFLAEALVIAESTVAFWRHSTRLEQKDLLSQYVDISAWGPAAYLPRSQVPIMLYHLGMLAVRIQSFDIGVRCMTLRLDMVQEGSPTVVAEAQTDVGWAYFHGRMYEKALLEFENALQTLETHFQQELATSVSRAHHNLGVGYFSLGQYSAAARHLVSAIDSMGRTGASQFASITVTWCVMGSLLHATGQPDHAAEFYSAAFERRRRVFGIADRRTRLALRLLNTVRGPMTPERAPEPSISRTSLSGGTVDSAALGGLWDLGKPPPSDYFHNQALRLQLGIRPTWLSRPNREEVVIVNIPNISPTSIPIAMEGGLPAYRLNPEAALRYAEWFVLPPVVSQRGQISLAAAPGHYDPDSGLMVPDFKQLKPALPLVVQGQPALGLYGYPVMVLNPLLAHYNPAAVPKVLEHLTLPGLNESVLLHERFDGEENAAQGKAHPPWELDAQGKAHPPIGRWESDEPLVPIAEVTDDSSPETPETQRQLSGAPKPMKVHPVPWQSDVFHCYHREGTAPLRLPEISPGTIAAACYITPASEPEEGKELPTVHICDKDRRVLCVLPYYIDLYAFSASAGNATNSLRRQ